MKIVEWSQDPAKPDEIVFRVPLEGGGVAMFTLAGGVAGYLARFCILHLNLPGQTEKEFLCDFKKLKGRSLRLSDARVSISAAENDLAPKTCINCNYSIRHTGNNIAPWLGMNGWQESRHYFDIKTDARSKSITGMSAQNMRRAPAPKKTLLAASVAIATAAVLVPLVFGFFGSQTALTGKDIGLQGGSDQTRPDVAIVSGAASDKKYDVTSQAGVGIQEGPARKVKDALKSGGHYAQTKKSARPTALPENNLEIPCTKDMMEKGILCK